MESILVVAFVFLAIIIFLIFATTSQFEKFLRWLKGSRTSYYIRQIGSVTTSEKKLRTPVDWFKNNVNFKLNQGVIEIGHGIFRRSSAVYGDYHQCWQVAQNWKNNCGGVMIALKSTQGLPITSAISLINTYPSGLQAMLDRIAELEKSHKADEARFQAVYAAVVALRFQIFSDKQRYRGVVAQELREDLDMIIEKTNTLLTDHDSLKVWSERFQEHRREVGQSRDGGIK